MNCCVGISVCLSLVILFFLEGYWSWFDSYLYCESSFLVTLLIHCYNTFALILAYGISSPSDLFSLPVNLLCCYQSWIIYQAKWETAPRPRRLWGVCVCHLFGDIYQQNSQKGPKAFLLPTAPPCGLIRSRAGAEELNFIQEKPLPFENYFGVCLVWGCNTDHLQ